MSVIEKVAEAVADQFDDRFVELLDPEGPLSSYGLSHAIARAVLEALRDQGDAMASARACLLAQQRGHSLNRFDMADAWPAMIDAALEEGA